MNKYQKELEKWSEKQLSHLKKPTTRKRNLVKRMAFAIMAMHKRDGVPIN